MVPDTSELGKYGRRTFIAGLLSIGLSPASAASMTPEQVQEQTEDPEREVPVPTARVHKNHEAVTNGEEPQRRTIVSTVPRDIWEQNRAAHIAARELDNKFGHIRGVRAGVVGHGNDPKAQIEYHTINNGEIPKIASDKHSRWENRPSATNVAGQLPEYLSATVGRGRNASERQIEVKFIQKEIEGSSENDAISTASHGSAHFNSPYTAIPAGCQMVGERRFKNQTYAVGTTCTPAYYNSQYYSEPVIVTAGHLFTGSGREPGKNAWQPSVNSNDLFGDCGDAKWDEPDTRFDAAWSSVGRNGTGTRYKIANDSGGYRDGDIVGVVTWEDLEQGLHPELKMQGRTSGFQNYSEVLKTYPRSSNSYRNIKIDASTSGGDSGGPYYDTRIDVSENSEMHLIAAVHYGYPDFANGTESYGTHISEVEQEFNLIV